MGSDVGVPILIGRRNISIHAPRVGSDGALGCIVVVILIISIHAPRVGSDLPIVGHNVLYDIISIHAPRVGSDSAGQTSGRRTPYFNPRSPCGERPSSSPEKCAPMSHFNPRSPCGERRCQRRSVHYASLFQSTLPVWGATIRWDVRLFREQ